MPTTADKVKSLRTAAKMTQADFAEAMHVSRDYISQIENGRNPSDRFKQQLELIEKVGIHTLRGADSVGVEGALNEDAAPYIHSQDTPQILRQEIRNYVEGTIRMAGEDVGKLGWLREQVLRHATPPSHWRPLEKGGLVPVTLPSQTQLLSSKTGLPLRAGEHPSSGSQAG